LFIAAASIYTRYMRSSATLSVPCYGVNFGSRALRASAPKNSEHLTTLSMTASRSAAFKRHLKTHRFLSSSTTHSE